jgi:hypothetical protein
MVGVVLEHIVLVGLALENPATAMNLQAQEEIEERELSA